MAKVSSIQRNNKRKILVSKFAVKRSKLKELVMNKKLPLEERFDAQIKMQKLPLNSNKNRVRNRCEITGRPRSFYRKFRISRIKLRELANTGRLPGVVKSSW